MYGGYYDKQLPLYGNKGIACIECKFSMHGAVRTKTWTTLSATVDPSVNAPVTQITLSEDVDWVQD